MHRKVGKFERLMKLIHHPQLVRAAEVLRRWVDNQVARFHAQRETRSPGRPARYVGKHRFSRANPSYSMRAAGLSGVVTRTGQARRTPTSILRSHMPKAKAKEDALARSPKPPTIRGVATIVSEVDLELIEWVKKMMEHSAYVDQTLHPRDYKYTLAH